MAVSRESLIDVNIETAVSRMQTVVELGRVIRDRRTLPMKVSHLLHMLSNYSCVLDARMCLVLLLFLFVFLFFKQFCMKLCELLEFFSVYVSACYSQSNPIVACTTMSA